MINYFRLFSAWMLSFRDYLENNTKVYKIVFYYIVMNFGKLIWDHITLV
jgi:hypothetical protein